MLAVLSKRNILALWDKIQIGVNMKSLKQLYKIGVGPSSSHTMGPVKAAERFLCQYDGYDSYIVTLYGSLALTGKGHCTDVAIERAFAPRKVTIVFDKDTKREHPNTMDFDGYTGSKQTCHMRAYSIGGGEVLVEGETFAEGKDVYALNTFEQIKRYCEQHNMRYWQYALQCEGDGILDYMREIWQVMMSSVNEGLCAEGILPGGLNVVRRAKTLATNCARRETAQSREDRIVASYAFAVGEQNASGGVVVTAPTCGASGVLPAVFRYAREQHNFSDEQIYRALLTAGIVGNVVKTNASIAGAECGCQAEIGTACSMAAAGLAELYGMTLDEIEYSAEVALEHHLGLTCDPVCGLVQIPCIERNAVAAMRSINAVSLATFLADSRKVSFDTVVNAMYETGHDLSENYRETSIGGLAKLIGGNK